MQDINFQLIIICICITVRYLECNQKLECNMFSDNCSSAMSLPSMSSLEVLYGALVIFKLMLYKKGILMNVVPRIIYSAVASLWDIILFLQEHYIIGQCK